MGPSVSGKMACSRSSDCGAKKWRQTLIVYDNNDNNNNNNNNNNKFIFCNYQCKNFQLSRCNHKEQNVKKKINRLAIIGHYSDKKLKCRHKIHINMKPRFKKLLEIKRSLQLS